MEIIKSKVIAHYNDLQVYEGATAYYLERRSTGEEFTIGDGVDMLPNDDGSINFAGTEEFNKAVQEWLEESYDELFEAYPFTKDAEKIQELIENRFEAAFPGVSNYSGISMDMPIFQFTVRDLAKLIADKVANDEFDEDLGDSETISRAVYFANESSAWEDIEDQVSLDLDEGFRPSVSL